MNFKSRKYYIIAGEASGDLHASNLIKELKKREPSAEFRCWGGDLMKAQGAELVKHYKDLAFMGFIEVLFNLRTILRNMKFCKNDILQYKPDLVILVDYSGFNLPIAKFTHKHGIKTFFYIAPQVWAWKKGRIKTMRKVLDKLFVILPFERPFFKANGMDVDFVGHPLLDAISDFNQNKDEDNFKLKHGLDKRPVIALLPGSRKQEINKMLSIMLVIAEKNKDFQFVIAGMTSLGESFYKPFIQDANVKIIFNETYLLLQNAHAALVTSGTATLETALFNVPEVVCYKSTWISYFIARSIVKIKYISLVNLIMDAPVVTELIQSDLSVARLEREFDLIAKDEIYRQKMQTNFAELRKQLGERGASSRIADLIIQYQND